MEVADMADTRTQTMLTVEIPAALHQAAKLAALRRRTTLRALVIAGLRAQVKGGRT
jgi:hypothetical protein